MNARRLPVYRVAPGVTIAEYAILLVLVLGLAFGGLKLLGGSISTLLDGSGQKAASNSTLQLLGSAPATASAGNNLGLKGSGYYSIGVNGSTGQPELMMIQGSRATSTNVSSIDGSLMNSLGATMLAKSLAELAAEQTDPVLQNYYGQMAKNAYYLAGAEGELDSVPGLDANPQGLRGATYTKGDGLQDLFKFSGALSALMNNPPAQVNNGAYYQAMPLAVNAYNIAKQYENAYGRFADASGHVAVNFGLPSSCGSSSGCPVGNSQPGSSLLTASQAVSNPPGVTGMIHESYDQIVSYDQIRAAADSVLAVHQVDNLPVASTIQDGQGLHTISQATQPPLSNTTTAPPPSP